LIRSRKANIMTVMIDPTEEAGNGYAAQASVVAASRVLHILFCAGPAGLKEIGAEGQGILRDGFASAMRMEG
jgi:hypothetical protein